MSEAKVWKAVAFIEFSIAIGFVYMFTISSVKTESNRRLSSLSADSSVNMVNNHKKTRQILVDLGANCGNSYEFFKHDVNEFYLIEPQTAVFTKWLVPRASSTVHVFNAAVSDHDEKNVPFFVDSPFASDLCTFDSGYPHGASSLNSVSATVDGAAPTQQGVQLIDIARFLRETVGARVEDYVILKVDIEGGEEKVLRRLMSENLLYLPDRLLVEWHPSTLAFQREFESSIFSYEQWKL